MALSEYETDLRSRLGSARDQLVQLGVGVGVAGVVLDFLAQRLWVSETGPSPLMMWWLSMVVQAPLMIVSLRLYLDAARGTSRTVSEVLERVHTRVVSYMGYILLFLMVGAVPLTLAALGVAWNLQELLSGGVTGFREPSLESQFTAFGLIAVICFGTVWFMMRFVLMPVIWEDQRLHGFGLIGRSWSMAAGRDMRLMGMCFKSGFSARVLLPWLVMMAGIWSQAIVAADPSLGAIGSQMFSPLGPSMLVAVGSVLMSAYAIPEFNRRLVARYLTYVNEDASKTSAA